jgi:hypothetical protein
MEDAEDFDAGVGGQFPVEDESPTASSERMLRGAQGFDAALMR